MSHADRLVAALAEAGLDQALVADLVTPGDSSRQAGADVFWLTGFSGTSGLCVIGAEQRLFFTDSRYTVRAGREVDSSFERITVVGRLVGETAAKLSGRVGYDERKISVAVLKRLQGFLDEGVELVAANELVAGLRRRKDADEIARIAEAARLADEVYEWMIASGFIGRSEREVALAAESRMRELGAAGPSFPTIVAAGENSALPHHEPGDRIIGAGEVVLVDMGVLLDGYCSDCTRTFVTAAGGGGAAVADEVVEVYEVVLGAQLAALEAVAVGATGPDVDAAARGPIAAAGYGDNFGHGLGHGVGVEVHEDPSLSPRSEDTLRPGDVVTVEPGVYLPGRFGIRIEDLVVIEPDGGVRNLSAVPKQLRVVG